MKLIRLRDKDRAEAANGAYKTYKKSHNWWVKNGRKGREPVMHTYYSGYLGEAAYCKYIGIKYKFVFYPHRGDSGVDVNDTQIKTVTWNGPNKQLKIDINKDKCITNPDVKNIFLMYIDEESKNLDTYIVGYISKQDFINKSVYNSNFYCNTVDEIDLIPPND